MLGVGTGEALNEIAVSGREWPEFKERFARLREAVQLMRALWTEDGVDSEGDYYEPVDAHIYDRPETPLQVYVAAGGPLVARYAGRAGDGFICTSGKGMDLYTDKLHPGGRPRAPRRPGATSPAIDRMLEVKISYDRDPDAALENTRFWAPLSLTPEQKHSVSSSRPRWSGWPTSCRSSRSPSAGSWRPTPTRRSRSSSRTSTPASTTSWSTARATTRSGS